MATRVANYDTVMKSKLAAVPEPEFSSFSDPRPLRYNAKAGTIQIVRCVKNADGEWENTAPEDITDSFRAIVDMKNVGACWVNFPKGEPPQVEGLVPMGQPLGKRPTRAFREAFRLLCKLDERFEDGPTVREILSSGNVLRDALSDVHTLYEEGVRSHPGQLPILIMTGKTEVDVWKGTAFRPIFEIDGWAPRPDELPDVPPHREDFHATKALAACEKDGVAQLALQE